MATESTSTNVGAGGERRGAGSASYEPDQFSSEAERGLRLDGRVGGSPVHPKMAKVPASSALPVEIR